MSVTNTACNKIQHKVAHKITLVLSDNKFHNKREWSYILWTEKGAILFSSKLLQILANLNENFWEYSWRNAEFMQLKIICLFV